MIKNMSQKIKVIDDSTKAELRAIDNTGANIIEKDFCLVMDNSAIMKYAVIDAPLRTPEHRIMLVKKGSVDHTLNYVDFHTSEGELLMTPANYIININGHSRDFNARVLSFRFANMVDAGLVGYDAVMLRLGYNEEQVFENFFQMMNQVLSSPTAGKRDFEHLVISMLYRIQGLNSAQNGFQAPAMGDRKQAIVSKFMQLLNANGPAPRSIETDRRRLCCSDKPSFPAYRTSVSHSRCRHRAASNQRKSGRRNLPTDSCSVFVCKSAPSTLLIYRPGKPPLRGDL